MHQTRWCVITGPPCSGKTTLIHDLEALGYPVVHEVARAIIWNGVKRGLTATQVRKRKPALQHEILAKKCEIENGLPGDRMVFLDRGIPDSIAYFELAGLDPAPAIAASRRRRYRSVCFLAPLWAYEKDPVRNEEKRDAAQLVEALKQSYTRLGYTLIHVPVMDRQERLAQILQIATQAAP